ncbi:hypothetical protein BG004_002354, partial [Podila humilis]
MYSYFTTINDTSLRQLGLGSMVARLVQQGGSSTTEIATRRPAVPVQLGHLARP